MPLSDDPLSQILSIAGAQAVVSTGLEASGRWAVSVPPLQTVKCNAIRKGRCMLEVGGTRWTLQTGDCFLVAPGLAFVLGTDLKSRPRPAEDVFAGCGDKPFARLEAGEGLDLVCLGGGMDLSPSAGLLIEALPPVSVIGADNPAALRIGWLLDRLEAEQREERPGSTAMSAQIMQMVFIELIRSIPGTDSSGWLAALSDPRIGAALRAMHRTPGRQWRLEDLAEISHLSRSRFASRFRASVGHSPIDYLTNLRMILARKALSRPGASVSTVAAELGYASENAFRFAFRRVTGTTPRQAVRDAA